MAFLERDEVMERLGALLDSARQGSGRLVVLRGEAGIGKTLVAKTFCREHGDDAHVLWGGCDDLITPQPLGPIWDMAFDEPGLEDLLLGDRRQGVFNALLELLSRSLRPTVLVIEDVHWADESTVDLVRYIGRRAGQTHGLVLLTYREDVRATMDHPIQLALGDLPRGVCEQISLQPLTEDALSQIAGESWDARELWRLTNGNPFFVTELIDAGPKSVPVSIRDAVKAKLLRLSARGRELVEAVSVVPGRVELSLISELFGEIGAAVAEAEMVGVLELDGNHISFRHELARQAVEGELPEMRRRELNTAILKALESKEGDVALRAHLARETRDADAMLSLLPLAASQAAYLGSHREALSHLRALEPHLQIMDADQLAKHYHFWAREEYLAGGSGMEVVVEKAVELRRQQGDPTLLGKTLRLASEITWWRGDREKALRLAEEAASTLQSVGGEELARAYSILSRWAMTATDLEATLDYAARALNQIDDKPSQVRVETLNNRGSAIAMARYPAGLDDVKESYRMAEVLGLPSHKARAAHNIGSISLDADFDIRNARPWQEEALALMEESEMPGLAGSAQAELARIDLLSGDWAGAERRAKRVLDNPAAGIHQVVAALVLARVLVRRGDDQAEPAAEEAWTRARQSKEPQRMGPAGVAVLEFAWLGNDCEWSQIDDIVGSYKRNLNAATAKLYSETSFWLSTLGKIDTVPEGSAEPFVHMGRGQWSEAADFWEERGIPYERALCLSFGTTEAKLQALPILEQLGAKPLAKKVRAELRTAGVKGVPRGPSQRTLDSPLRLTPRQTEVLELLAEELTNAEIAERLFVSRRTIDHHVSAILSKLAADDRGQAVANARDAGIVV